MPPGLLRHAGHPGHGHAAASWPPAQRSALGRIGTSLSGIPSERTPIQLETQRIVKRVAAVGLSLALCLALAWWLARGDWLHGLLAGLTLAMAMLPEELPVVLTCSWAWAPGGWRARRC